MDRSISDADFAVLFILPDCLENSSQQNVISMVSMELHRNDYLQIKPCES